MGALVRRAASVAWCVENEVGAVADLVPIGGTCVDVGAEYGLYTVAMAARVGVTGTVHAVEPQPDPNRVLDRVLRVCGVQGRVVRHRYALSDRPGTSTLSVPLRRGRAVHGRAFVTRDAVGAGPNAIDFGAERALTVRLSTLDELATGQGLSRLDMVKVDVEGAELQVLVGGAATIERFRPLIQLEIEQPHLEKYATSVEDVVGPLRALGYGMHVWATGGWQPTASVTPAARNYLFVP